MTLDWQSPLALTIVAAATVYLIVRCWRVATRNKAGGCGACGGCSDDSASARAADRQIVSVDALIRSAKRPD